MGKEGMSRAKNALIVLLLALLVWFGSAIVELERYRYASAVGFCGDYRDEGERIKREACLEQAETRTSPFWHLLNGLGVL
ncbi:hypothetical protein [Sphingomonas sp.]|uniref:hypothetical protein n=1 Tax=Sphingomonas sp. TaxID=28214 RepID=UPI00307FCCA4